MRIFFIEIIEGDVISEDQPVFSCRAPCQDRIAAQKENDQSKEYNDRMHPASLL
jgi:hypothetical protein